MHIWVIDCCIHANLSAVWYLVYICFDPSCSSIVPSKNEADLHFVDSNAKPPEQCVVAPLARRVVAPLVRRIAKESSLEFLSYATPPPQEL